MKSNGIREFARLDATVDFLPTLLFMMPSTIKLVRTLDSQQDGIVRLLLDVTLTDQPGGAWTGTVKVDGGSMTATFGPIA